MRLTEGLQLNRPGLSVKTVKQMWEYTINDDSIHCFVLCHTVDTGDDYTAGTAIEFTFSAPSEDMIGVDAVHFKGTACNEPAFKLNRKPVNVIIKDEEKTITLLNGKMSVVITKGREFGYSFYYEGKYLTGSDNKSFAYVADGNYEAKTIDDVNHRTMLKPYMDSTYMMERLNISIGENFYGLGERFTQLVKNGQTVDVWNRDGGSGCNQAYKCIPFYLSSRSYGIFVNTTDYIRYEFGTESVRHVQFSVEDEKLSYIVIGGDNPKEVLANYTGLTGRTPVPPTWSFGLWLSTSWIPNSTEETVLDTIDKMKDYGIPLSVYHFDARWMEDFHDCDFVWSKRFGDAKHMLDEVHKRNVKACVWINPYISQISRLYDEGLKGGYFIKKKDGSVFQTDMWMCGSAYVDFTNPEAVKWFTDRLGEIIDMGVDVIKTDFAERLPVDDIQYYDGSDPRRMHNYYTYLYNKAVYELLKRKKGDNEAIVFARSATAGTQQFPINWGGDNQASYISLAESLRGGLSFCQSGYGFWCHDMAGFDGTPTPDLYKRGVAFGLMCTHSRLHGHISLRMPWCFDEESCKVLEHFTKLKLSLMPYIYAGAVNVHTTGIPEMRAMMLEFPRDPACSHIELQYMLGDNLLVAPILRDDGEVTFYLPSGEWTDLQSKESLDGEKWYTKKYDYYGLPLLVRENSIIARRMDADNAVYDYTDNLTFEIYNLADGASTMTCLYKKDSTDAIEVIAKREGNTVYIERSDRNENYDVKLYGSRMNDCMVVKK